MQQAGQGAGGREERAGVGTGQGQEAGGPGARGRTCSGGGFDVGATVEMRAWVALRRGGRGAEAPPTHSSRVAYALSLGTV